MSRPHTVTGKLMLLMMELKVGESVMIPMSRKVIQATAGKNGIKVKTSTCFLLEGRKKPTVKTIEKVTLVWKPQQT